MPWHLLGMAVPRAGGAGHPGQRLTGDILLSPTVPAASAQTFLLRLEEPWGRHRPFVHRPLWYPAHSSVMPPALPLTLPLLLGPRGAGLHLRLGVRERGPRARQLQL